MAFDETLAERIRMQLGRQHGLTEKKMFGGIGFMLNGNMCCGVHGRNMIVRLDPQDAERALNRPYIRAFDLTGRPMKGWLFVEPEGLADDEDMAHWVQAAVQYASTLPAK